MHGAMLGRVLAIAFFVISLVFVWRSFYGMRIGTAEPAEVATVGSR